MKQVLVFDGLHEFTIRPPRLFDEYIAALGHDIERCFADRSGFETVPCPGCGGMDTQPAFAKLTFQYVRCVACESLFVSPRPPEDAIAAFMEGSEAIRLWSSRIEPETALDRVERIFRPRVDWMLATAVPLIGELPVFADLESKYPAFLAEVCRAGKFKQLVSVAPAVRVDKLTADSRLTVIADVEEAVAAGLRATVVSAQECLERAPRPSELLEAAARLTVEGGLLFLTTMASSGFDIQVLGARAKNVLPPVHLNLLSLDGLQRLLSRHGFEVIELSTPGQLDTEAVVHAVAEDPALELPPFIDDLIRRRGEAVHQMFQEFLQQALLSSHVRIAARKSGA
jgi:hypothetical protein